MIMVTWLRRLCNYLLGSVTLGTELGGLARAGSGFDGCGGLCMMEPCLW